MGLLFLLLCISFFTNSSSRFVDINDVKTVLKLLVDRGDISEKGAKLTFSRLNAIATGPLKHGAASTIEITVNDVAHQLSIPPSGRHNIDRSAARFCITTGVSAEQCVLIRDSLLTQSWMTLPFNATYPTQHVDDSTIQCHISDPDPSRWQFTEQRVYFNIKVPKSGAVNTTDLCYHIDFDIDLKHCGSPHMLTTELYYLPRPSYTRVGFQPGWHSLTVQPEATAYSPDMSFFYVAEPYVEILSASLQQQHAENGGDSSNHHLASFTISAQVKVVDFRLGVDGTYCVLLDWQVVSCTSSFTKAGATSTSTSSAMVATQIESQLVIEHDGKHKADVDGAIFASGAKTSVLVDIQIHHHKSHRRSTATPAAHTIAIFLKSIEHHEKAVAVSSPFPVMATSSKDAEAATPPTTSATRELRLNPISALPLLQVSEWGMWSQNGEDGILLWIFSELGMLNLNYPGYFVEFGVEDGYECNTRFLREQFGWNGLLMDGGHKNETINLQQEFITAEVINNLFDNHNVPREIDFLSIDLDFNDWWILKAIFDEKKYTAKVIAVEYNSHVPPNESKTVKYNATNMWDGVTDYFGAGAAAFDQLGAANGYRLIYCESHGVNAFLVREDLVTVLQQHETSQPLRMQKIYRPPNYFGRGMNYPKAAGLEWIFPFDRP